MVVLMCLAGLAEGVGVITLVPVLETVESTGRSDGGVSEVVGRIVGLLGLEPTLPVLLALIVLAITAKAVALRLANQQIGYTVARVVKDFRITLMRALLGAQWSYFIRHRPGQFANAVATEAHRAAFAYREACALLAALIQMTAYLVIAALISLWVAAGTLIVGWGLAVIGRGSFVKSREAGGEQTLSIRELTARLLDALQGIKPIKAMNREGLVWPLLENEAEGLNQASRKEVSAAATLQAFQEPVLALALAVGLYIAVQVSGQSLSSLLVLAFIFYRLVGHISGLQRKYQVMLVGESAFVSMRDQTEEALSRQEVSRGVRAFSGLTEAITFEDVTFGYGARPVLDGLSLTIPAGQFVAVHGESGVGKTTLADLLVRLHEPASGRILVDGVPLSELDLSSWRSAIGYVPQEILLFHDSILMNVTLGDPALDRDDARRALELAGAWGFVQGREQGLDATIGSTGSMLSGGQRQRIAIARALVGKPSLLILDEVTAALDPETEGAICRTLSELAGEVTILSISHQSAMREIATTVYEMRGGRLELADTSAIA